MPSSQIISSQFEYIEPANMDEALKVLQRENFRPLSGGTDLINRLKDGREKPAGIVYIARLPELTVIRDDDPFVIGSAVPMTKIERHPALGAAFPGLVEAVNSVGSRQIRNTATMAGNLGNASPGADTAPPLISLGAELVLVSSGSDGITERLLPVQSFFSGPGKTVLEQGELIKEIRIPRPPANAGSAFGKIARVTLDIAKINCAVYLERQGRICSSVRIVLGSVAPTAVRASGVEKAFTGAEITGDLIKEACSRVNGDIAPISDIRSTADYRLEVASVLVGDVFIKAWERSGGDTVWM